MHETLMSYVYKLADQGISWMVDQDTEQFNRFRRKCTDIDGAYICTSLATSGVVIGGLMRLV